MPEKSPLFLESANLRLPQKKYPFIRESGYESGIRFDREERGVSDILQRQVNGNHDIDNGCIMGMSGSALRVICYISKIGVEISRDTQVIITATGALITSIGRAG